MLKILIKTRPISFNVNYVDLRYETLISVGRNRIQLNDEELSLLIDYSKRINSEVRYFEIMRMAIQLSSKIKKTKKMVYTYIEDFICSPVDDVVMIFSNEQHLSKASKILTCEPCNKLAVLQYDYSDLIQDYIMNYGGEHYSVYLTFVINDFNLTISMLNEYYSILKYIHKQGEDVYLKIKL